MSTCGVTPAGGPSPAALNAEAIAILREMHSNQNKTNEKVETLAMKVDELYNFDYDNEYDNFEEPQDLDLHEDPHDIADESSSHGSSSIHIDIAEGTPKRPMASWHLRMQMTLSSADTWRNSRKQTLWWMTLIRG